MAMSCFLSYFCWEDLSISHGSILCLESIEKNFDRWKVQAMNQRLSRKRLTCELEFAFFLENKSTGVFLRLKIETFLVFLRSSVYVNVKNVKNVAKFCALS